MKAIIVLTALALGGCAAMPDRFSLEAEHVSHPLAGWPVSANDTEDGLSQANLMLKWKRGRVYMEQGIGVNLQGENGGGFYGPELTYTGRIGVDLWCR